MLATYSFGNRGDAGRDGMVCLQMNCSGLYGAVKIISIGGQWSEKDKGRQRSRGQRQELRAKLISRSMWASAQRKVYKLRLNLPYVE